MRSVRLSRWASIWAIGNVISASWTVKEEAITTSPAAFKDYFKKLPTPTVVAIEVGPHSRWVSQVISECGHDAIVANPLR